MCRVNAVPWWPWDNQGCDGWLDVLFNSNLVISQDDAWADDNERLCAMEPRLRLKRSCLRLGSNS